MHVQPAADGRVIIVPCSVYAKCLTVPKVMGRDLEFEVFQDRWTVDFVFQNLLHKYNLFPLSSCFKVSKVKHL